MAFPGLELFMEKLEHLIYSTGNPLINNHPLILSERPQFQLLYQDLDSMIKTLFIDEHHELQQLKDLKKRFEDAAQDAHDKVDLFVYTINCGNQISLNLGDVVRSINSIKEEFIKIRENMKTDPSPRTNLMKTPSAATDVGIPSSRNHTGSKNVLEDIVVGFDHDVSLIRDKLVEDTKQLDVVSIVGMGGLGKTTLATKVFNDPFVVYHFHVRGWVTFSQTNGKQDLLIQLLESIGIKLDNNLKDSYSRLREMLHKKLMRKRFLIVIDDIWSTKAWDDLKLFFPNDHTGSRILLTSRLKEVALHAKSHGLIHQLRYLTEGESWELLCRKVFHGDDCPKSLIEPGMQIAKNCHGLPLTLVVIAGVLSNEEGSKDSWERIGRSVSSHIVSDQTGYIKTLALSIDHLPGYLRDCFLYLGGFPEDYMFKVQRLIWLWMAEGFIQEDRHRSLEEIAENYLMELVDRNLAVVAKRKSNGGIKVFYVHDLLRELCSEIATIERFFLKTQETMHSVSPYKQRRIFIEDDIRITNAPMIRSLLYVYRKWGTKTLVESWYDVWMLLMVLDIQNWMLDYFPKEISLLIHLRYLAFWYDGDIPSSICNLWSLQTLIVKRGPGDDFVMKLPTTISNLVNLRHLHCEWDILFPPVEKPMNLQTISNVRLGDGTESLMKCFPRIKKLLLMIKPGMEYDFESLTSLENLKISQWIFFKHKLQFKKNPIGFPVSLKKLTLEYCYLLWSDMSILQSLPKLEVLKLLCLSFVGPRWDAGEEPFRQLKFLKLSEMKIKQWEASSINFPCLKQLVVEECHNLEEIPSDFGYIPTLELIDIHDCGYSVIESLDTILEEQHAQGNFELKIRINSVFKNYVL